MKKRFSEEQIVKMIQEHKQGKNVSEISREYGVAEVLNEIWHEEKFKFLQTDNGPEFRSSAVQSWCIDHDVKQFFSRPGKPTDNCFIESFNRIFRDECLNENYFSSLSEAKQIIESWRIDYNENRPQKGLKELTPSQFKTKLKGMKNSP